MVGSGLNRSQHPLPLPHLIEDLDEIYERYGLGEGGSIIVQLLLDRVRVQILDVFP